MRSGIDPAAEAVLLAGAGRAILLQLANPAVGIGVARHSDFAHDPMKRFHGTVMYVYAVMAGSDLDRARVSEYVNRKHGPVHGAIDVDGVAVRYDARDPELQLWVAATLYETSTQILNRVFGPLNEARADDLFRRYALLGQALQMPPGVWPVDRSAFAAYWAGQVDGLAVDASVRAEAAALWRAVAAPWWVRCLMPLSQFVTAGLLPDGVRRLYGMTWTRGHQRCFDGTWAVVRWAYPRLPGFVRTWPQRYYLARGRRLAQEGERSTR